MKINKILAPLLLLSLVNGLYNPIEAALTIDNPVLTMHIYYNGQDNKFGMADRKEVVLVEQGNTTQTDKERAKIIDDLIRGITTAIGNGKNRYMRFWMELSKDHIEETYKESLGYWFNIFSRDELRPFTELFIEVDDDEEENSKKQALNSLIEDQEEGVLFFQKKGSSNIDDDKEIFTQNFTALGQEKNLEEIQGINKLLEITEALNKAKQALQEQKGGDDVGSWNSLVIKPYQALMGTIARYKIAFGIILTVIVSLAMVVYYKRDALAAFAHRQLNRKGL